MKCVDIRKNTSGEGDFLDENWRWGAKARGANGIRYPGSPGRKRWVLGVGGIDPFCAGVNAISTRLGSTTARLKLKGIDGGPHKRWSMWFNSTQREEPYQVLTLMDRTRDSSSSSEARKQVVHGCRQLVSWDVGLSPATSATPILCCQHLGWELMRDCRRQCGGRRGWRQIIMPLMTWATHVLQWELIDGSETARWSKPEKHSPVRIVGCNSPTWSRNR